MNIFLFIAGIVFFIMGISHSILGEYLIFKNKRNKGSIVPSKKNAALKERHLRILWATWHLSSFIGLCIGAILIKISLEQNEMNSNMTDFIVQSILFTTFIASFLVFFGTKGKHPGWLGFLLIVILLLIGS